MPFARPTLTQLRSQVLADIASSDLPQADSLLRRAVLRVLGTVQAGLANLFFGYLDWVAKQATPFTATDEYAESWGALVNVTRKPATFAQLQLSFAGATGTPLQTGTPASLNSGFGYVATAAGTWNGTTVTVPVQATVAGSAGNADVGTQVRLGTAIVGIGSVGTVTAILAEGADVETDDSLKARYLAEYAAPPHGGDQSDYVEWALAVPGVTRAWCLPHGLGPGTVQVYVMLDGNATGGFPVGTAGCATAEDRDVAATGDLLTVANAIFPLQPVTALVYSCPPAPAPQAFVINNVSIPSGGAALVEQALADMFVRLATPLGAVVLPSQIEAAIASVPGISAFTLAYPTQPIFAPVGQLMTVGTINYGAA